MNQKAPGNSYQIYFAEGIGRRFISYVTTGIWNDSVKEF